MSILKGDIYEGYSRDRSARMSYVTEGGEEGERGHGDFQVAGKTATENGRKRALSVDSSVGKVSELHPSRDHLQAAGSVDLSSGRKTSVLIGCISPGFSNFQL